MSGKDAGAQVVSSLSTTRQMLDELDALMERMLAVPVHETEEPTPAAKPAPPAPPRPAALAASLTPVSAPPPRRRVVASPKPAPPAPPVPVTSVAMPATTAPVVRQLLAEVPPPAPRLRWLAPLLALNRAYDRATLPLGLPGRWLRGAAGRVVLGYTGVALVLLTILTLMAESLGWTW